MTEPTFTSRVHDQVDDSPDAPLFVFLPEGEVPEESWTYADLDDKARRIAGYLQCEGARPGDRALLLFAPGSAYVAALFGCLYAGVVAVPAYPPDPTRLERTLPRLQSLALNAEVAIALTESWLVEPLQERLTLSTADGDEPRWLCVDVAPADAGECWEAVSYRPNDLAVLQYTSGSTGAPKGVMLEQRHILANIEMIVEHWNGTAETPGVNWLPPYHDMGLIGSIFTPFQCGTFSVLMPPYAFLKRPARWLEALTKYRGYFSAAPNFAYDLVVRKTSEEDRASLDLSHWMVAINGSEPVRAETLARFVQAFEPCGFKAAYMRPCFGMAETTLIATAGSYDPHRSVLHVDKKELAAGRVTQAEAESRQRSIVSCGEPIGGMSVEIVDPNDGTPLPEDWVGELRLRGPSVAAGYWGAEDLTAEAFPAPPHDSCLNPGLRTGDLGFLSNGQLFVTGRVKEIIIVRGRNHYPQDIEQTVEQVDPRMRPGCGAAFSVERGDAEALAVVQEYAGEVDDAPAVMADIRRMVLEDHGVQVEKIALVEARSIPKTSSGKIQRRATREALEAGELPVIATWPSRSSADLRQQRPHTVDENGPETLEQTLVAFFAERVESSIEEITPTSSFVDLGLDSAESVVLAGELGQTLGRELPAALLLNHADVRSLAAFLSQGEPGPAPDRSRGARGQGDAGNLAGSIGPRLDSIMRLLAAEPDSRMQLAVLRRGSVELHASASGAGQGENFHEDTSLPWGYTSGLPLALAFAVMWQRHQVDPYGSASMEDGRTGSRLSLRDVLTHSEPGGQLGRFAPVSFGERITALIEDRVGRSYISAVKDLVLEPLGLYRVSTCTDDAGSWLGPASGEDMPPGDWHRRPGLDLMGTTLELARCADALLPGSRNGYGPRPSLLNPTTSLAIRSRHRVAVADAALEGHPSFGLGLIVDGWVFGRHCAPRTAGLLGPGTLALADPDRELAIALFLAPSRGMHADRARMTSVVDAIYEDCGLTDRETSPPQILAAEPASGP